MSNAVVHAGAAKDELESQECKMESLVTDSASGGIQEDSERLPLLGSTPSPTDSRTHTNGMDYSTSYRGMRRSISATKHKVIGCCGEPNSVTSRQRYNGTKYINAKYESLNYEMLENDVVANEIQQKKYISFVFADFMRWALMFFIGIITALVACGIDIGIEYIAEGKFKAVKKLIDLLEENPDYSMSISVAVFMAWVGISVGLVSVVAFLVVFIEPVAAGSGIPEIKCYLNGIKVPHVVRLKTLFVKAVGVLFSVGGGLTVGKEGPMIHAGAAIAAGVSQGRLTSFKKVDCTGRFLPVFKSFRNDTEKRDFVASGAAAGVAAAFGAPIGGVLFSLEEGASFVSQGITWRMFFASMSSVFMLNFVLSAFHNHIGNLSYNGIINFGVFSNEAQSYQWYEIPIFLLMGFIGGVLGALFNCINYRLTLFRRRYIRTRFMKFLEPLVVVTITVTVAFVAMFASNDCKPNGTEEQYQDTFGGPVKLFCGDGEFNSMATLFLTTPETSIKNLFHDPTLSYTWINLAIFAVLYFCLASWTYGLMVSSGLFIPSLLVGASWGRVLGIGINRGFPTIIWSPAGRYALVGAAAMLGGVVRMTISLTVIVMEASRDLTYGLPIMLSIMVAKWVGDLFNEGLYDIHVEVSSIPLLPWDPPHMLHSKSARDIMKSPVVTLNTIEKVERVYDVLRTTHNGFPVVTGEPSSEDDSYGLFKGLVLRYQLIMLLKHKVFGATPQLASAKDSIGSDIFSTAYPRFPNYLERKVVPSEKELDMYIDLRPYMNNSTYCAFDDFKYPKLFYQFRYVGLRHLVIVNRNNKVVGIVTRKDLARFHLHSTCGKASVHELELYRD